MEPSILISVKKVLGLDEDYTPFDQDIIQHINGALSVVSQLGVGTDLLVQDNSAEWDMLIAPQEQLNLVKTYVFLRTRILFDPPTSSFLKDALEAQLREYEWRLSTEREYANSLAEDNVVDTDWIAIDGGTPGGLP